MWQTRTQVGCCSARAQYSLLSFPFGELRERLRARLLTFWLRRRRRTVALFTASTLRAFSGFQHQRQKTQGSRTWKGGGKIGWPDPEPQKKGKKQLLPLSFSIQCLFLFGSANSLIFCYL